MAESCPSGTELVNARAIICLHTGLIEQTLVGQHGPALNDPTSGQTPGTKLASAGSRYQHVFAQVVDASIELLALGDAADLGCNRPPSTGMAPNRCQRYGAARIIWRQVNRDGWDRCSRHPTCARPLTSAAPK